MSEMVGEKRGAARIGRIPARPARRVFSAGSGTVAFDLASFSLAERILSRPTLLRRTACPAVRQTNRPTRRRAWRGNDLCRCVASVLRAQRSPGSGSPLASYGGSRGNAVHCWLLLLPAGTVSRRQRGVLKSEGVAQLTNLLELIAKAFVLRSSKELHVRVNSFAIRPAWSVVSAPPHACCASFYSIHQ